MGKANGGTTNCHYKVFSNKFSNPYQPLVKGFRQDEGPGVGQGATEIWRKSIPVSFHFAWCLLLKSSNSPLTQISALKLEDALVRLAQSSSRRWSSPKVERGWRQGGMKTNVSRRGGQQLRLGSIKRKGKHDVGVKRVRGATRNREVNPGFLLSLPWRAPKVPTNTGKGSKSTKTLPPYPKEFRIRELLLCQPRKKDVTVGWTQYE